METIGSLLAMIGTLAFWVSFVSVIRPLKRIGLPTRKRSALVLLLSCVVITTGAALAPDEPDQSFDQAAQEPTPQSEAPADSPPPAVAAGTPEEQAATTVQEPTPVAGSPSAPGPDRIDGDNNFGCRSRDYYSKLVRFAVQGDQEAWSRALAEGALSGECILFKADEPVFVTDTALFSGLVKVRRKGKLTEYWTNFEAVTR